MTHSDTLKFDGLVLRRVVEPHPSEWHSAQAGDAQIVVVQLSKFPVVHEATLIMLDSRCSERDWSAEGALWKLKQGHVQAYEDARNAIVAEQNGEKGEATIEAAPGIKHDAGKPRWDLLPWREVGSVVDVLTHGAAKYSPGNWKRVEDQRSRYFAAAMRHLTLWWGGERLDEESGRPHLAHAACCVLFLMWGDVDHD